MPLGVSSEAWKHPIQGPIPPISFAKGEWGPWYHCPVASQQALDQAKHTRIQPFNYKQSTSYEPDTALGKHVLVFIVIVPQLFKCWILIDA